MYNILGILFLSLKFNYYHYYFILNNSKRQRTVNFFYNNIIISKTLNLNFFFQKYWYFGDKQLNYYLGYNSIIHSLKKKKYFFKYINTNLSLKRNNVFNSFLGSNFDGKSSKNFWRYKYINVIVNFCDWSFFFKNSIHKSKVVYLLGNSHPIQNNSFAYLKKFSFDDYNDDSINFNVDVSNNSDLNYNKKLLISEFFFFNNSLNYNLDIDNEYFLFFLIKLNSRNSLFQFNKFYFKNYLFFNFNYFLFYPYYFENNQFSRFSVDDSKVESNFFFNKLLSDLPNTINLNFNELTFLKYIYLKKKLIMLLEYKLFFVLNFLIFYGPTKKKKKYNIKTLKKKSIKKIKKNKYTKIPKPFIL